MINDINRRRYAQLSAPSKVNEDIRLECYKSEEQFPYFQFIIQIMFRTILALKGLSLLFIHIIKSAYFMSLSNITFCLKCIVEDQSFVKDDNYQYKVELTRSQFGSTEAAWTNFSKIQNIT